MIYLDNSASTIKKPKQVYSAVKYALKNASNPGRSSHNLSIELSKRILNARLELCNVFSCPSFKDVIFLSNCSEALNLAISGLVCGGEVLTSVMEHNSVLRVLKHHEVKKEIKIKYVSPNSLGAINPADFEKLITPNTKMAVITHISNVTGALNPIKELGKICKKHNIIFIVDSAQGAGVEFLNMQECGINCLCLAGHKNLYGIQGVGVLLLNGVRPSPIKFGGNGVSSDNLNYVYSPPECYEVGTLNSPAILALDAGVKYVEKHQKQINKKLLNLTAYLFSELKKFPNLRIISCQENCYGVVTFTHKNYSSAEIANFLNKHNIAVRSGLQCAPLIHKHHKTNKFGAVRVSLSGYNTRTDIKKFINAIKILENKKTTP